MTAEPPEIPEPATGSRGRILAATAELILERGIDGATIAAVCERANVPVSSVYWHFDDKDSLVAEVITASYRRWVTAYTFGAVGVDLPLEAQVRALLEVGTLSFSEAPLFHRIGMQFVLDLRESNVKARAAFIEVRGDFARRFADRVLGLAPERADDLAWLYIVFADGLIIASQIDQERARHEQVELFTALLAHAVR